MVFMLSVGKLTIFNRLKKKTQVPKKTIYTSRTDIPKTFMSTGNLIRL